MEALKFTDAAETIVEGIGMPWGGVHNGQDLQGEHFDARTDFAFDWFPKDARPALFQHGLDSAAKSAPVGRVIDYEVKADMGVWVKAQLDASSQYFEAIKELVKAGKLYFSSGSMRHLVETDHKTGAIKRWPWVEISLTPTPANLLATLDFATAEKHFEAAGIKAAFDAARDAMGGKAFDILAGLQAGSLADHAEYAAQIAASLTERTKDLRERRVKEGRVMSGANMQRMADCMATLQQAMDGMTALMDSMTPAKAEAKAQGLRRLQAQLTAMQLRAMTMRLE
ncbi:MAG: hypothetical protein WC651_03205 [Candidatus Gracilibacteria bacterium]|jgi:hypothetical protein